jgi:spectinomycin phosphotransferase
MLYPFLVGTDVWQIPLSAAQWIAFGKTMKAIHTTALPASLAARVPREDYAPRCRDIVRHYSQEVAQRTYDDRIAEEFAAFWRARQDEIERIVQRAEQLGQRLQHRANEFVVCHTDVHAGNVMVGPNDELTIVDWDNPLLAPKERDLMFVGGGIGNYWKDDADVALFYQGYCVAEIDWVALCYYRCERIVADIAAYAEQIFGVKGSVEEREEALGQITGQFEPNEVIDIAHRTYEKLI